MLSRFLNIPFYSREPKELWTFSRYQCHSGTEVEVICASIWLILTFMPALFSAPAVLLSKHRSRVECEY